MSRSDTRSICEGSCGAVRGVLVDTGALVALVRARDRHHALVAQFFGEFLLGEFITTLPVLTEALHLLPAQLGAAVIELAVDRGGAFPMRPRAWTHGRADEEVRRSADGLCRRISRLGGRRDRGPRDTHYRWRLRNLSHAHARAAAALTSPVTSRFSRPPGASVSCLWLTGLSALPI